MDTKQEENKAPEQVPADEEQEALENGKKA